MNYEKVGRHSLAAAFSGIDLVVSKYVEDDRVGVPKPGGPYDSPFIELGPTDHWAVALGLADYRPVPKVYHMRDPLTGRESLLCSPATMSLIKESLPTYQGD